MCTFSGVSPLNPLYPSHASHSPRTLTPSTHHIHRITLNPPHTFQPTQPTRQVLHRADRDVHVLGLHHGRQNMPGALLQVVGPRHQVENVCIKHGHGGDWALFCAHVGYYSGKCDLSLAVRGGSSRFPWLCKAILAYEIMGTRNHVSAILLCSTNSARLTSISM